jgi:hypothetical protein
MTYIDLWHQHPIFAIASVVVVVLVAYPSVRILHKMGYSGWWAVILAIPMGGFAALWILAFSDWPALRQKSN